MKTMGFHQRETQACFGKVSNQTLLKKPWLSGRRSTACTIKTVLKNQVHYSVIRNKSFTSQSFHNDSARKDNFPIATHKAFVLWWPCVSEVFPFSMIHSPTFPNYSSWTYQAPKHMCRPDSSTQHHKNPTKTLLPCTNTQGMGKVAVCNFKVQKVLCTLFLGQPPGLLIL